MPVLRPVFLCAVVSSFGLYGCQDDDRASTRFPITVTTEDHQVSFVFDEPVHEIEVTECTDGCSSRDDHCFFDAGLGSWNMGVGAQEPDPSTPGDARLDPPTIVGPVIYGALSPAAGWATPAWPLHEGSLYSVEVDVYGPPDDDTAGPAQLHVDRYACAYFTVEDDALVPLRR